MSAIEPFRTVVIKKLRTTGVRKTMTQSSTAADIQFAMNQAFGLVRSFNAGGTGAMSIAELSAILELIDCDRSNAEKTAKLARFASLNLTCESAVSIA